MRYYLNSQKARFYRVILQPTLFGAIDIACVWGSTVTKRGNCKIIALQKKDELDKKLTYIHKLRIRKGYHLKDN